ncbi:MAG: hypothetical protein COV76_00670 [Candidatus Omnitrophica bacterium CG11_big_fil_rev_8_21_14_0_20_64_10]|nr:MAG: hypothetical protein COV76_00670 [Candidatus Omnitrophica bacterium CG11_big_fil_rev_8_21_14_0_20_64_10]
MRPAAAALLLGLLFGAAGAARADVLYLKDGSALKGLVVEDHEDRIVFSQEQGEREIFRDQIDEIFYDDPEWNYLYLGNQAARLGEMESAKRFFRKALQLKPGFVEAKDALGWLGDLQGKAIAGEALSKDPLRALEAGWRIRVTGDSDGYPVVSQVTPGENGAHTGLQAGDRLIAVWGHSLKYLSLGEAARRLWGIEGTPLKATIGRRLRLPAKSAGGGVWPGLGFEMVPQGLTIREVAEEGAAARAGFQAGDRVTALQERPTRYLPLKEAEQLLRERPDQEQVLEVHRDLILKRSKEEGK